MVIEVDVILNQESSLVDCLGFTPADTFCLQYTKEVFSHCVIIAISSP